MQLNQPTNQPTYQATTWSRILPENLTRPQLIKKFPAFYAPKGSLPHSHTPTTFPDPQSDQSYSCLPIPLLDDQFSTKVDSCN